MFLFSSPLGTSKIGLEEVMPPYFEKKGLTWATEIKVGHGILESI